jgi:UDP-glucose 4-epimerase
MGNVVGRRQTHGVGFDFINKLKEEPGRLEILGDGTQQKSYVHVSDVIKAHLFVSENTKDVVNVFNLATDDTLDVTSIARIVLEEMELKDTELAYTGGDRGWKGDVPQVRLPAEKLKAAGWSCAHNSMQAVRRSVREMLGKE